MLGGEAAIPLQLGREGGGASDILGSGHDRVTSGVGVATWGIVFLGQLWWCALLDMDLLVTPLQPNKE